MFPIWLRATFQVLVIGGVFLLPSITLWVHKYIMKETWNDDMADRVTIRLFILAEIGLVFLSWLLQECGSCS